MFHLLLKTNLHLKSLEALSKTKHSSYSNSHRGLKSNLNLLKLIVKANISDLSLRSLKTQMATFKFISFKRVKTSLEPTCGKNWRVETPLTLQKYQIIIQNTLQSSSLGWTQTNQSRVRPAEPPREKNPRREQQEVSSKIRDSTKNWREVWAKCSFSSPINLNKINRWHRIR